MAPWPAPCRERPPPRRVPPPRRGASSRPTAPRPGARPTARALPPACTPACALARSGAPHAAPSVSRPPSLRGDAATGARRYVKYCSSDFWSGDAGPTAATFGYSFRGSRIVAAVISDLVASQGLGAAAGARMLFAGCSAGAIGAMNNLEAVALMVPSTVTVEGFLDGAPLPSGTPSGFPSASSRLHVQVSAPRWAYCAQAAKNAISPPALRSAASRAAERISRCPRAPRQDRDRVRSGP